MVFCLSPMSSLTGGPIWVKHELHHKYTDYSIFLKGKKIDLLFKKLCSFIIPLQMRLYFLLREWVFWVMFTVRSLYLTQRSQTCIWLWQNFIWLITKHGMKSLKEHHSWSKPMNTGINFGYFYTSLTFLLLDLLSSSKFWCFFFLTSFVPVYIHKCDWQHSMWDESQVIYIFMRWFLEF